MSVSITDDGHPISVYSTAEYGRACAAAEGGSWISVRDDNNRFAIPLVVRHIPGTSYSDAVTPYGYAGIHVDRTVSDSELREFWTSARQMLAERNVVSAFLRFPPFRSDQIRRASLLPDLDLEAISKTVLVPVADPDTMWTAMHKRSRSAVRAAERSGCTSEVATLNADNLREARDLYELTMRRVKAAERYFFPDSYYDELSSLDGRVLVALVRDSAGKVVAASFILLDEDIAHYHLSGSTGSEAGANNLMIWAVMKWAHRAGLLSLHLGGGLTVGDSLHRFKGSFGGVDLDFHVGRTVIMPSPYADLVASRAQALSTTTSELRSTGFFPVYRAFA